MNDRFCLLPCSNCNRHVRSEEATCPFCGTKLTCALRPPEFRFRTRLGRNTSFTLGAALVSAGFVIEGGAACAVYGQPPHPSGRGGDRAVGGSSGSGGAGAGGMQINVGGISGGPDAGGVAGKGAGPDGVGGTDGDGDGGQAGGSGAQGGAP